MAGHRDDGMFAEDKAHHPNRKVHREMFIEPDQANPLGMVRPETNAIPDAHDPGNIGEMNHDARLRKGSHELWVTDHKQYDWLLQEGSREELHTAMEDALQTGFFGAARIQPYGHNKDRYFSPSSPDFSGDTQYERATHPAYKGHGPYG